MSDENKRQSKGAKKVKGDRAVLQKWRELLEKTQLEFAVELKIDPATISRCERGLSEPRFTVEQFKKLCKLVNIDRVDELPDYLGARKPNQDN